jgi:putative transposase
METTNIVDFARRDGMMDALTDLLRTGAQQLIATAVEAELASYLAQFADLRTETGHAAVVRNGHHPERPFQTGIGPVSVRIPKVRSKDGQPVTFRSALVPPYVRRTKTLEAALPWLYLKGISSGEMAPAFKVLLGPEAKGLSANTVSRLKRDWAKEYDGWREVELDDEPIVYIWADGVHSGLRGEDDKLCALVIVGVTARGKKRFLAIEDGVRESTQSWREVLAQPQKPENEGPKIGENYAALITWPKSSPASHSKTESKPQTQTRSLHDPKFSNTRFDNSSLR